jgi:hypothetical protein
LSAEEKSALVAAAAEEDRPLSAYGRRVLVEHLRGKGLLEARPAVTKPVGKAKR